jgi:tetratricopeptide (TPR) repeat protein
MIDRLTQIHADIALHFNLNRADAEYVAAFREYGVDVERLDPAEAGARLATSPVASELANALDQWAHIRRDPHVRNAVGAERLMAVAKATDPDPWRNTLRDTLSETATDRSRAVDALQRLASTADPERLPEASVTRLASALSSQGSRETAIDLLRRSQRVHPDDFWLNHDLAGLLAMSGRPEEAVRFYSVALAIRPRSEWALHDLGEALRAAGRTDEADLYPGAQPPSPGPPGRPR